MKNLQAVIEESTEIFEQNILDENIYSALGYDEIKALSDKLIEKNLQAYVTLANA